MNKLYFLCMLLAVLVASLAHAQNTVPTTTANDTDETTPYQTLPPLPIYRGWSPGRISQVVIAISEAVLLTLIIVSPDIMDPIVTWINSQIGENHSRKRRNVEAVLKDQTAQLHGVLMDAIEKFEHIDEILRS